MIRKKFGSPGKSWSLKKILLFLFSGLLLLFLLLVIFFSYLSANYSSWLGLPTVIVFTGQFANDDQQSAVLVMNVQAEPSESQLVLLSGSLAKFKNTQQFSQNFGILANQIVKIAQPPPDQEGAGLRFWLVKGLFQQVKQLDFNAKYTFLALNLLSSTRPVMLKQASLAPDFFKLSIQEKIKPMVLLGGRCPITVSNATNKPGLATNVADFLTNQGGVVVRVINHSEILTETEVLVDQDSHECQAVAQLLASGLTDGAKFKSVPQLFYQSRSQIELRVANFW